VGTSRQDNEVSAFEVKLKNVNKKRLIAFTNSFIKGLKYYFEVRTKHTF
jgi:hypothetical protein